MKRAVLDGIFKYTILVSFLYAALLINPAFGENAREELNLDQSASKIELPAEEMTKEIYVLKKIDPNRIGVETSYETFSGIKIPEKILKSPSVGVGQRVEIYQEPKPVDSYMMMAKEMQYVWSDFHGMRQNLAQKTPANLRSMVQPLFVRAYGTELTVSDPNASRNDTQGQIRFTLDYRDVYKEYYPKFVTRKVSEWLQPEVTIISSDRIDPLGWLYTSNIGWRYSTINVKDANAQSWALSSSDEWRNTYYINQSLAPNPRLEVFTQLEYFKSRYGRCSWTYEPDHYLIAGELRLKSADMKTSYTGRLSYSLDVYSPTSNTYEKYEVWARVGRDFNDKFNAYTMLKYVYGHTRSEDNAWWQVIPGGGWWQTMAYPGPYDITALALTWENRAQYNIYDRLWLQGGLDLGTGLNMSDFDNVGYVAGLEYYAPGIIRLDVGWRGNQYYNINDFLSTIYFKLFLFM